MVSEISLELVLMSNHQIYSAVLLKISIHLFFVKFVTYRNISCILMPINYWLRGRAAMALGQLDEARESLLKARVAA